jgi:acyl carrier protein
MSIVFSRIKQILHESYSIQLDQIQLETKFELELGTDSREFFELLNDFEKAFDIEINLDDIVEIVTIQDIVIYIEKRLSIHQEP